MKRKFISFVLSFILIASICIPTLASSTTSQLQNQKDEIKDQIQDAKDEQNKVKQELSEQMKEISDLNNSIEEVETQIKQLENKISTLQSSISQKQKELEVKQAEHDANQALMEDRMVVMYEKGETSFLDMLFSSKNIVEFISNYYLLQQLADCDKELLETIEQEQEEIGNSKQQLENEKAQIDSAKTERETKSNILKSQKAEKEQKANALSAEEQSLQNEIEEHNRKIQQIESQIQAELKRIEEERKNQNASNNGSAGIKFDGSFVWPCDNRYITSTVKNRWGRKHKGLDIGARYENVYATASGYAYPLENPGGYGHYIIVIHGNNYISLYGHLNAYKVSYGQYVTQGQVIAQSGNSGASQGAHLHFEIRRASSISSYFSASPLNPLDYLSGGYTLAPGATTES